MLNQKIICIITLLFLCTTVHASVNLYQTFQEANSTLPGISQISTASRTGDINGDGFGDIWLKSENNIYIYFGANHMDTNPDVILERPVPPIPSSSPFYGYYLTPLFDLNNDGYDDFAIGYGKYVYIPDDYNTSQIDFIDINYGSPNPNIVINGDITSCPNESACNRYWMDTSPKPLGDVDGDGYADYAITGGGDYCQIYTNCDIYLSSSDNMTYPKSRGFASDSYCTVIGNNDINGDGLKDILLHYHYAPGCGSNSFQGTDSLHVVYGSTNINLSDTSYSTTLEYNFNLEYNLKCIGDINNNNKDDLAQIRTKYGFVDTIAIFPGEGILTQSPSIKITDTNLSGIRRVNDINNDDYDDFLIGKRDKQSLKLFYGQTNYTSRSDSTEFIAKTDESYQTYNSAGDVNNDNYEDIILVTSRPQQANKASLYYGGSPMDTTADVVFDYQGRDNSFGWAVSGAGDMNGDGFDDFISGAFGYYQSTGRAYIYLGNNPVDYTADLILTGENTNDFFGIDVNGLGDINNDGYDEIIVGAEGYQNKTGRAYVYFGGYMLSNQPGLTLNGENEGDYFGKSVSAAGDVNGDGFPDIIAGAKEYNFRTGRAYIYLGGTSPDSIPDIILDGDAVGIDLGADVSGCGDINNDGFDDVIVGADYHDDYRGKAFVYFGGNPMDSNPDLIIEGEDTGDYFGSCVTSAGDVNKDGFDDFAIGAFRHNTDRGRVYLYYGNASPDSTADVIFDGQAASENFGRSLADAGDANQDGYDDLFIGAYVYDTFTGRAYLYHGGPAMDNIPDEILTGEAQYSYFGSAVSGAGDVNDDGTMDLVVGAYKYGDMDNGKVYLYEHEPAGETITYNFTTEGWYLISLPVVVQNKSVQDLFPTALNGHAFYWNGFQYVAVDTMESHKGYWINIDQAISLNVTGIPIYHYVRDFNEAGWYLLGSVIDSTDLTDPVDTPDEKVLTPAFGWNAASQSYEICNQLEQTQSCWVAVMEPCQLDINSSAAQGVPKMNMALLRKKFGSPPPPPYENKTSSSDNKNLPKTWQLYANYPNPFNPTTTIKFDCPKANRVHITIYNILGQKIRTLMDQQMNAGTHHITWDAKDEHGIQLSSNIYFIRMQSKQYVRTIKTILMK